MMRKLRMPISKFLLLITFLSSSKIKASFLTQKRLFQKSSTILFGKRGQGKVEKERVKKTDLPEKICCVCGRPFTWRKKWERSWDEITTCSKACNGKRRAQGGNVPAFPE